MTRRPIAVILMSSVLVGIIVVALAASAARSAATRAPAFVPARGGSTEHGRAVVVIGASIAGGYRTIASPPWPRLVDAQLGAAGADGQPGLRVINASVGATQLLTDSAAGLSYRHRLPAVLATPGVTAVLITDLINDIQAPPHVSDPTLIENGLRDITAVAHQRGVAVIATTITAWGGYHYTDDLRYNATGEACRQAVNDALRAGGLVDQVIDLDVALADPTDPHRLDPRFDSADHLHPNDAGHRAMADRITTALSEPEDPASLVDLFTGQSTVGRDVNPRTTLAGWPARPRP